MKQFQIELVVQKILSPLPVIYIARRNFTSFHFDHVKCKENGHNLFTLWTDFATFFKCKYDLFQNSYRNHGGFDIFKILLDTDIKRHSSDMTDSLHGLVRGSFKIKIS